MFLLGRSIVDQLHRLAGGIRRFEVDQELTQLGIELAAIGWELWIEARDQPAARCLIGHSQSAKKDAIDAEEVELL